MESFFYYGLLFRQKIIYSIKKSIHSDGLEISIRYINKYIKAMQLSLIWIFLYFSNIEHHIYRNPDYISQSYNLQCFYENKVWMQNLNLRKIWWWNKNAECEQNAEWTT